MKPITFIHHQTYFLLYKSNKTTHKTYFRYVGTHYNQLKFMSYNPKTTLFISPLAATKAVFDGVAYLETQQKL